MPKVGVLEDSCDGMLAESSRLVGERNERERGRKKGRRKTYLLDAWLEVLVGSGARVGCWMCLGRTWWCCCGDEMWWLA